MRGGGLAGGDGDGFGAAVGERGGDEDGGEAADAADEGGAGKTPVFAADVVVGDVAAGVDGDAEEDEDLGGLAMRRRLACFYDTYDNRDDFQQTEPVFKLSTY